MRLNRAGFDLTRQDVTPMKPKKRRGRYPKCPGGIAKMTVSLDKNLYVELQDFKKDHPDFNVSQVFREALKEAIRKEDVYEVYICPILF